MEDVKNVNIIKVMQIFNDFIDFLSKILNNV